MRDEKVQNFPNWLITAYQIRRDILIIDSLCFLIFFCFFILKPSNKYALNFK